MPVTDTQSEYIRRLNLVLDYIQANLDQPLSLSALAGVAGFSPFHFHRIFKSVVREPLNAYIQRLRLEKAANWLSASPAGTVLEIAVGCGFSSAAAFSRAFRTHFGLAPSEFRKQQNSKIGKAESKPGKALPGGLDYSMGSSPGVFSIERSQLPMNVEVKNLPDLHVAFVRHLYGYQKGVKNRQIGEAFQKVTKWVGARNLFGPATLVVGIPYDNPEITPNDRCRYDACVTVPPDVTASMAAGTPEIGIQDIPGGKYAVCHIEVSASEPQAIGETVDQLYGAWLPASGFQADDKPPLEIYYPTPQKPPDTWVSMDYCLPVKPL